MTWEEELESPKVAKCRNSIHYCDGFQELCLLNIATFSLIKMLFISAYLSDSSWRVI